jgi:hypothetical protein
MPIAINGSGTLTGLSVGGLEDGIITPAELSTGGPGWDAQSNLTNVASINNGPLAGMRNAIINGNFDIWQRGTSFTSPVTGAYTADRWGLFYDGSGATRTIERVNFPLGQTDVPGEPAYMLRFAHTVGGTGATFNVLAQFIEDVRTFAGQQVTVSFYIRSTAAITLPALRFIQRFGTGGSPSASISTDLLTSVSITTSWQRIQATVTVPSILGKTLGSNDNSLLALDVALPLNSTFSVDIAQVQVEPGAVATAFERRPIGTELALCQRYFFKTSATPLLRVRNFSAGTAGVDAMYQLPVSMRISPTVSATGDINDGASFTTWAVLFGAGTQSVYLSKNDVLSLQFLDVSEITASAEL